MAVRSWQLVCQEGTMGRGIRLTHEELNLIDLLRLKTLSKDVFRNCLIITMSHFGDTIGHIAERLGCSTETVVRIRREYRERGLDALKPEKPPGRPSRATPEYIAAMKEAVATGLWILDVVYQTTGRSPQENHGNRFQRRSVE